jgi:hypothetical protein
MQSCDPHHQYARMQQSAFEQITLLPALLKLCYLHAAAASLSYGGEHCRLYDAAAAAAWIYDSTNACNRRALQQHLRHSSSLCRASTECYVCLCVFCRGRNVERVVC